MNQFGNGVSSAVNHLRATSHQWHHPHISRAEGAQLLEGCEAGAFVLRESSKGGSYALSVILPGSGALGHYLVEKRGPECFCLQGSENAFCTIEELLAHYHHHDSIGLPCRLRLPQRHSSSMSYPSRPSLPPLPPRNNSRASSISRPTLSGRPKVPGTGPASAAAATAAMASASIANKMGMPQPHLDVRRPYPFGESEVDSSQIGVLPHHQHSHVSHPHQAHPVATHGSQAMPGHAPHMPRPGTAPPGSALVNTLPRSSTGYGSGAAAAGEEDEFGETYEDMAAGGRAQELAKGPLDPRDVRPRPGATHGSARVSPVPQSSPGYAPSAVAAGEDEFGETYEDMSAGSRVRQLAQGGHGAGVVAGDEDEFGETYEDMTASRARQITSGAAAGEEDEFGETYEDMAAGRARQITGAAAAGAEDEFGETYEDMAVGGLARDVLDEIQDTYEDMASVSPNMMKS